MENAMGMTLFDVAVQIRALRLGKARLRTAVVGADPGFMANMEAYQDLVLDHAAPDPGLLPQSPEAEWRFGFNIFAGPPGDKYRPSRTLAELRPEEFDLIVVADTPQREPALAAQVLAMIPEHQRQNKCFRFSHLNNAFAAVMRALRQESYITTMNSRKTAVLACCLDLACSGEGEILESGTFMGGSSILMAALLKVWGERRKVHGFDTFEGIPSATKPDGTTVFHAGEFTQTSLQLVSNCVASYQLSDMVELHKGLVQETVPVVCERLKSIAFVFADTDQYAGTRSTLKAVLPRLHSRGLILIDDYFEHGVRRAVAESLAENPGMRGALVAHSLYSIWKNEG